MRVLLPFLCYRYEVQLYHCLYWNLKFSFNFTFIGVRIFSVPVAGCIGQQKLVSCWKVGQLLKYWSAGEKLVSCINIGQQMLVSCWKVGQQKLVSCWNIGQLLWVSSSAQASHWRRKQPWQIQLALTVCTVPTVSTASDQTQDDPLGGRRGSKVLFL